MIKDVNRCKMSADRMIEIAYGFRAAKALMAAIELDVFTILGDRMLDAPTLIERLQIAERGGRDFLDALVALGLLRRDDQLRYGNTLAARRYLDRDNPTCIGGLLEHLGGREYPSWQSLAKALRTGKPTNEVKTLASPEFFQRETELERFARGMTGGSLPAAEVLAVKFPWRQYPSVLDVGTSEGCLLVQVALAQPHIVGRGFDRPQLKSLFERYVAKHELADRLGFHAGNFFVDAFPETSVIVMGRVLHNWGLEAKRMLLRKAYAALHSGGALVIYERFIDDGRNAHAAGLLSSLNMLLLTEDGFDFTAADCAQWLKEAGFRSLRTEPLTAEISMIVARK